MNGPEHYAEAERLVQLAIRQWERDQPLWQLTMQQAQVSATLANAAALSSLVPTDGASGYSAWRDVVKPEPPAPWDVPA